MKILIPTDFSKTADKALRYAIDRYNKSENTFILYHSFVPFSSGFYSYTKSKEENDHKESELRKRLIQKADKFLANELKAALDIFVDRGVGEKSILKFAKNHKIDLIIMGTNGASGLKEKLIGSVTANVMSKSGCPVIGIPANYKPGVLKEIAFYSNYRLNDIGALEYLSRISDKSGAGIQIWHFHERSVGSKEQDKLSSTYETMVRKFFRNKNITFHFSYTDDIQQSLDKLSRKKGLNMIALIAHRKKGFLNVLLSPDITKRVAYHTKVPLLAIPSVQN